MPKQPKFRPVNSPEGWRLNVPKKLALSGKRERYFFKTREEALTEAAKLRGRRESFGDQASAIAPSLAEQATAAAHLLAPFGITLMEAAQRVASLEQARAASSPVESALAAFQKAKEDKSAKQVQSQRHPPRQNVAASSRCPLRWRRGWLLIQSETLFARQIGRGRKRR